MNDLMAMTGEMTMGTREIAELLGKNHSDIKRSAERLRCAGVLTQPLAELNFEHRGNTYTEYRLNKLDSITLVAQNSPKFTAALVKRWDELERGVTQPSIPQTLPEALRLAADLAEKKAELENQLAIAAPKVDFADRVSEAGGVLIGNYAKAVGIGQNKLFAWLRDNGVLMAAGERRNVPRQEYLGRGYFTVKETAVNTNHGVTISFTSKITGKGQQWLTRKLLDHGLLKAIGEDAA